MAVPLKVAMPLIGIVCFALGWVLADMADGMRVTVAVMRLIAPVN